MLGWTGSDFRSATLGEYFLAFDGYLESRGIKKKTLMSRNELLDLMDADKKRQAAKGAGKK